VIFSAVCQIFFDQIYEKLQKGASFEGTFFTEKVRLLSLTTFGSGYISCAFFPQKHPVTLLSAGLCLSQQQGCQMVCFQTQNPKFGYILEGY
jgi:hypothetical protein